jgi:hypothetical protein
MVVVHANPEAAREFRGDQAVVWDKMSELSDKAEVHSATGAMKDVYEAKRGTLDDYLKNFQAVDGQKGMLVFLDGRAVGFDFVSRPGAFGLLFPKLVKSYAMEAMIASEGRKNRARNAGDGGGGERQGQGSQGPRAGRRPGLPGRGRRVRGEEAGIGGNGLAFPLFREEDGRVGAGGRREGRPHGLLPQPEGSRRTSDQRCRSPACGPAETSGTRPACGSRRAPPRTSGRGTPSFQWLRAGCGGAI